ncbi:MAG: hypothetical protein U0744_17355 [Gemmataceae bacterium]
MLRQADAILLEELMVAGIGKLPRPSRCCSPVRSVVGVMGDERMTTRPRCSALEDYMTADWSHLPYDLLARISTRIINQVKGVNRVVR